MVCMTIRIRPPEEGSSIILEVLLSDSWIKAEIGNISERQLGEVFQSVTSSNPTPEDILSELKRNGEIKVFRGDL